MSGLSIDLKQQLSEFSLNIKTTLPSSGLTVVFGPSGCGKTTLLRCLAGLMHAKQAEISFDDDQWQNKKSFVQPHKRQVAMVFQSQNLLPHLDVKENINYAIKRRKRPGLSFDALVEMFDLEVLTDRHYEQLSGGEQQRVAMARALASAPRLLLLDEPMSALDDERKSGLLVYLKKIKQHTPIIYVTHSRYEMMRLADHVLLMKQGRVVASGDFWQMMQTQHQLMAGQQTVWSVLQAEVGVIDEQHQLCQLTVNGGLMWADANGVNKGDQVRMLIDASDVSVSLSQARDSSVLNVVPVTVKKVTSLTATQCQVDLSFNGAVISALLTHKSIEILAIETGQPVFAQIKAVALIV